MSTNIKYSVPRECVRPSLVVEKLIMRAALSRLEFFECFSKRISRRFIHQESHISFAHAAIDGVFLSIAVEIEFRFLNFIILAEDKMILTPELMIYKGRQNSPCNDVIDIDPLRLAEVLELPIARNIELAVVVALFRCGLDPFGFHFSTRPQIILVLRHIE